MKIILTNAVMLNGGDAAIIFGMQRALRTAFGSAVQIAVHVSRPEIIAPLYPELTIRETAGLYVDRFPRRRYVGRVIREMRQARLQMASNLLRRNWPLPSFVISEPSTRGALEDYASADLIVSAGGTYLRDDYGMIANIADYRAVLALRKPLAFFTQSVGPLRMPLPTHPLRCIFDQSICVLLRDERSAATLRAMHVHGPAISVVPDAAFALGDESFLSAMTERSGAVSPMRVAISVREWQHFESCSNSMGRKRYVAAVAGLTRHLLSMGATEIVFLSTCQGITAYDDDSIMAEEIVNEAGVSDDSRVVISRDFIRFDRLLDVLKRFDFAVCTRLHVAILSMLAAVPVVQIAYEFKSSELFAALGLSEYVVDIEMVSAEGLIKSVDLLQRDLAKIRRRFVPKVIDMCARAKASGVPLRDAYEKRLGPNARQTSGCHD